VSSRIGFLQEDADLGVGSEDLKAILMEKGVIQDGDVVGNMCYGGKFLEWQLERSRENLGLETVDLVNLHNPENFLGAMGHADLYDLIGKAFRTLEDARQDGKLKNYGVSSYMAFRSLGKYYLSLQKLTEIAENSAGKDNGFKFINLPINITMPESFIEKTQMQDSTSLPTEGQTTTPVENSISTLKLAEKLGLNVIAISPLMGGYLMGTPLPADVFNVRYIAGKHVNFARSLPFDCIKSIVVGMKRNRHVKMNLQVAHYDKAETIAMDEFLVTPRVRVEEPMNKQFFEA
jgi:diketogulonate reductase-like aldo/keto reductase